MSNRPDILMRVGAAFDRSFDAVLADAAKKYDRAFGAGRGRANNELVSSARDTARQQLAIAKSHAAGELAIARDTYRENSRLNRQLLIERSRAERQQAAQSAQLSRQRTQERIRAIHEEERAEAAHAQRLVRMQQQSERERNRVIRSEGRQRYREQLTRDREIDRFATRTSHRATRFFFPPPEGALGYMKRTALDVARGAGVDFSLGGGVARAKEREAAGMGLAQQERVAEGGKSRGAAFWSDKSLEVGTELGVSPEKVTEMMRAFTGKTGDFGAAVEKAKELASITLASGANMDEMGAAAGYVYNQLKGMPDAADRTLDVMRGIVGQTAVGAVEMEEYAKQMGRIAANAKMFQGDVTQNILELSALTQLSIAEGGATSGADAARSIAAFANTTSKGARINAFKNHGIELFNEGGTQKRPILEIIKASLIQSKGNIPKMTQMWADTLGQKPIRGLTNAFNEAGGGEAGWQAALAKIAPFMNAQLDKDTERKNLEDYNKTMTARAQRFQNQLDRITDSMANRLLPTLEQLAPKLLMFTEKLSGLINWAAENPGKAITLAITASIARAGLESVGRLFLDRLMTGVAGQAIGGGVGSAAGGLGGAATVGGALGTVGGALGVVAGMAAVGFAAYTVTSALLELADAANQKSQQERARTMNEIYMGATDDMAKASNPLARQQIAEQAIRKISAQEEARTGTNAQTGWSKEARDTIAGLREFVTQKRSGSEARQEMSAMGYPMAPGQAMTADDMGRAFAGALIGKTMEVRVRNVEDFNFTPADGSGPAFNGPPRFDWGT